MSESYPAQTASSTSYASYHHQAHSNIPHQQLHHPQPPHQHFHQYPPAPVHQQQQQQYRSDPGPSQQHPDGRQQQHNNPTAADQIVASRTNDWTASLIRLSREAELKKHALTLQVETTRIVTFNTTLQKKQKVLTDYGKQREKLESQRASLLDQLRQVNENREKVDLEESKCRKECDDIRRQIQEATDGDYSMAKTEVDKLRRELGLEATKSLQTTLEEKSFKQSRRTSGANPSTASVAPVPVGETSQRGSSYAEGPQSSPPQKRGPGRPPKTPDPQDGPPPPKRPRGRPKGSKNKPKEDKDKEPGSQTVDFS